MRFIALVGALAFTLCAGICEAEDARAGETSKDTAAAKQDSGGGSGLKHIDTGDDLDQNVDRIGTMGPGQNYDGNTGFPNVVESDADMDLE